MKSRFPSKRKAVVTAAALAAALIGAQVSAQTVTVRDPSGAAITTGVRWVLEEDRTFDVKPGITGTPATADPSKTLSLQFHRSYMPVVATGDTSGASITLPALDPAKRYFLSVLPKAAPSGEGMFAMGGIPVRPDDNGSFPASLTAVVDNLPLKTSQISVLVYDDRNPINNQADAIGEQEHGLCGFEVHLYDAGGTYGASGGRISTDVYGNPLGTEYANGDPAQPIPGTMNMILKTDRNGVLRIKNLAPGKYTIFPFQPQVRPTQAECPSYYPGPNGQPALTPWPDSNIWSPTSTVEGTQGDDGWVKANEPTYFKEFGPPGHHITKGFAALRADAAALSGPGKVNGRVVNIHMSRPPNFAFYNGQPVGGCRVGLNESNSLAVGGGMSVWAGPCNSDGTFEISGTKPNTRYQLAVWDDPLDNVFASYDFVTDANGNVNLKDVPVFNWFGHMEGKVCQDLTGTGFCADGSFGISGQAVNIRFRDGSIYQSAATDDAGKYEFPEVFPFFNWMVAEVDFARFKATGMTSVVDTGGPIPPENGWTMPSFGALTPQPQKDGLGADLINPNTGNNLSRTETGPVLTQGVQTFLGLTNRLDWGKAPYATGENGGISGLVKYASTRAESDPRFATAENNEPGVPGVTVELYRANPANPRQVDPAQPNPIAVVTTDSWDDSTPTECQGEKFVTKDGIGTDCYDGLRNFNQVRPAVFDGGYAFSTVEPAGVGTGDTTTGAGFEDLKPGSYIVKVIPPAGYEIQKEEDKNVDFGDYYGVSSLGLPAECVGLRTSLVPTELSLFPGVEIPAAYRDSATKVRPLCDMKAVTLTDGKNAGADFHLFTVAPVSGHIVGMILDDTANEFDPHAPAFGEKYAPPFMPISLRDMAGREFSRVYSDRYGTYNALVPSTFTFNVPMPSGVSPNMIQACLNSPYMTDPVTGAKSLDPHYNKSYTQFCYNFQYLPGKTTYLDTPVLPIAAFAGPQQFALDCEQQDKIPGIFSVSNPAGQGPWIPPGNPSDPARRLTITSMGLRDVLNPAYDTENPGAGVPKTIKRDYGFGAVQGTVTIGGTPASIVSWSDTQVVVQPGPGASQVGELLVTRGDNQKTTPRGVTVHAVGQAPIVVQPGQSIQAAVDAANPGGLVTVAPGTYEEAVIIDKRVRVQGFGAGGTLINPLSQPTEKLQAWRKKMCDKIWPTVNVAAGTSPFLLPGQTVPTTYQACLDGNVADNAPLLFGDEESPGFFVLDRIDSDKNQRLQVDGFTIAGADIGGGINVNGYAARLEIANNLITGNQGIRSGGIRIGNPDLVANDLPVSSRNTNVSIHHNEITQNGDTAGAVGGGGGGIGIFYGSNNYRVANNFVCGNYSSGNGGGLAHLGVSSGGVIEGNQFLWNQSFYQGNSVQGGGVSIAGQDSLAAAANGTNGLSTGTGDVTIAGNTFQGNLAEAGDGGAIYLAGVNGNEVGRREPYRVDVFNNVIVNNVAAVAGGGIAMVDSPNVRIVNNTIAHNDSAAVAARTFNTSLVQDLQNGLSQSQPQPGAGVASYVSSAALAGRIGGGVATADGRVLAPGFSNAMMANNLVGENRQFHFGFDFVNNDPTSPQCQVNAGTNACYGLVYDGFNDIGVVGDATNTLLPSWQAAWQQVVTGAQTYKAQYFNGPRDAIVLGPETHTKNLAVAAAFDEGGNFVDLRYGPLAPLTLTGAEWGNYQLTLVGGAGGGLNLFALSTFLQTDRAGVARPAAGNWLVGAYNTTTP